MKWLNKLIENIDTYFSKDEKEQLIKLRRIRDEKQEVIRELQQENKELRTELSENLEIINDLQQRINKLTKQKSFKDTFEKTRERYKWKPNRKIYLHNSLKKFSEDDEYKEKYLQFLKNHGLKKSWKNKDMDYAVYKIVNIAQDYINNDLSDDYRSDADVFNVNEYWLSPQEAYDQYVENDKVAGDCEDTRAFIYGCLISGLGHLGFNHEKRILCVDIRFPVGHAILSYKKMNGVWAGIETTYYENRFMRAWIDDKNIFRGFYTTIWHIFDENNEYELR